MMLTHEAGVLSALLSCISQSGASVLTITQSLPIRGSASVTISLDVTELDGDFPALMRLIESTPGVEQAKLLAIE